MRGRLQRRGSCSTIEGGKSKSGKSKGKDKNGFVKGKSNAISSMSLRTGKGKLLGWSKSSKGGRARCLVCGQADHNSAECPQRSQRDPSGKGRSHGSVGYTSFTGWATSACLISLSSGTELSVQFEDNEGLGTTWHPEQNNTTLLALKRRAVVDSACAASIRRAHLSNTMAKTILHPGETVYWRASGPSFEVQLEFFDRNELGQATLAREPQESCGWLTPAGWSEWCRNTFGQRCR